MKTSKQSIAEASHHSIIRKSACGFTLVEMLVVMGILAILIGASIAGFSHATDKARSSLCQELVHNVATALEKVLQDEDGWPQRILQGASGEGKMTDEVGGELARRKVLSLTYRETTNDKDEKVYKLVGLDQCGVVSPWARDVIKRLAAKGSVSLSARVPSAVMSEICRRYLSSSFTVW